MFTPPRGARDTTRTGEQTPQADSQSAVARGNRDPVTGRLVVSAKRTLPTAKAFVEEFHTRPDGPTLASDAGLMMAWRENRYVEIEDETLRHRLQARLHQALQCVYNRQRGVYDLAPFDSNPCTVKAALDSVRTYTSLPIHHTPRHQRPPPARLRR